MARRAFALSIICLPLFAQPKPDWPQWGGPTRDFHSASGPQFAVAWPATGPAKVWSRPLGAGHAQVAVQDGMLYTTYRQGSTEIVIAADAATGATKWEHKYEAPFSSEAGSHGHGPYATPLIVGDRVFTAGSTGILQCLEKRTGQVQWSQDLWAKHGGNRLVYGYASSPLAYRDTVIVPIGGEGKALAAFRQTDGTLVWKKGDAGNAYSSPQLISVGGLDQVAIVMRQHVVAVNPLNGDVQWSVQHRADYGINISTPLWVPESNILVVSSAYGAGTRALRLTRSGNSVGPRELWHNPKFYVRHANLIHHRGLLWGANGGAETFHAADLKTGQIVWQKRAFPRANSVLLPDARIVILDENGELTLARPSVNGLESLSHAQVLNGESWTPPSLVGTRLYVRNRAEMAVFELGTAPVKPGKSAR